MVPARLTRRTTPAARLDPPAGPPRPLPGSEAAIVAAVACRMQVPPAQIYARDRMSPVAAARQTACWALIQAGLSPAAVARHFGLNHTTVVHACEVVARHPDWQALARPAIALAGLGGERAALDAWLAYALANLPAGERAAIRAYTLCTLLGWTRAPAPLCIRGLWLLDALPAARAGLARALTACGLEAHLARLALHRQQAARPLVTVLLQGTRPLHEPTPASVRRPYLFVGERQSPTAHTRGWTWESGRLCAGTLARALASTGVPPEARRFCNLWAGPGLGRSDEPPNLDPIVMAFSRGERIVALSALVHRALMRAGIPHLQLIHPAARGRIRASAAYAAHVRAILGAS